MSEYFSWKEITMDDFSPTRMESLYNDGFVFTRKGKGIMQQTRSVRVDLSLFELSSENRRILKKTEGLELNVFPLPYTEYHWSIGKMAKNFYDTKFGEGTFSANKIKEMLTDEEKSNFTSLFKYVNENEVLGYTICFETKEILHYSYPFYNLESAAKDTGLGMMTRAILYAKEKGKKYVYLGSAQRPTDTYKFQFAGTEWFDGVSWQKDVAGLKEILT